MCYADGTPSTERHSCILIFLSSEMGAAPIPDDKIKYVAWLLMVPFAFGDKNLHVVYHLSIHFCIKLKS